MEHLPNAERFAGDARAFLAFLRDVAPALPVDARFRVTAHHLAVLQAGALLLEPVDLPPGGASSPRVLVRAIPFDAEGRRAYFRAAHPLASSAVETGDLAEDMEDIQAELIRGLASWDAGTETGRRLAHHHWVTSFWSHWGHHAVEAQRALHAHLGGRAGD